MSISERDNYLEDDWDDNNLIDRTSPATGFYRERTDTDTGNVTKAIFRPDWTDQRGSPTATGGELSQDADEVSQTTSILAIGEWSVDWQFQADPTNRWNNMNFMMVDNSTEANNMPTNGYWAFANEDGSSYNLQKRNGGTGTNIISSTWADDTNQHSTKVTRSKDAEFELFLDGTSQGTTTDAAFQSFEYLMLGNSANVTHTFDNLLVT